MMNWYFITCNNITFLNNHYNSLLLCSKFKSHAPTPNIIIMINIYYSREQHDDGDEEEEQQQEKKRLEEWKKEASVLECNPSTCINQHKHA